MALTKTQWILLLLLLLAVVLRLIAAHHTHVSTDEMIYTVLPFNMLFSGQLGTVEQSPLFFYLTDVGYKLTGGLTAISARLLVIIFGTLGVIIVYLFSKELFKDQQAALLSAFLYAASNFALSFNYEMDMAAYFFAYLSLLFFLRYRTTDKAQYLYLTSLFLALGILMKIIVALFAVIYVLFLLLDGKLWKRSDSQIYQPSMPAVKAVVISMVIAVAVLSPVIIYNYLTYTERGIGDYFVTLTLGIGDPSLYRGVEGEPWMLGTLWVVVQSLYSKFLHFDPLLFIIGLLGILFAFRKNRQEHSLLLLSLLLPVLYVGGKTGSATHYVGLAIPLSIYAGYALGWLKPRLRQLGKFLVPLTIIAIIVLNVVAIKSIIAGREESITLELREYTHQNIPPDAIVVIDPRIYTGIHAWVFHDRHYFDGQYFAQLMDSYKDVQIRKAYPFFYVECGAGSNCGWKPEDYARVHEAGEQLSTFFRQSLQKDIEIRAGATFIIYKGQLAVPPASIQTIDRTHRFWFNYPVGWKYKEGIPDAYSKAGMRGVLHWLGITVLYVDMLLVLLTIVFLLRMVFRQPKNIKT